MIAILPDIFVLDAIQELPSGLTIGDAVMSGNWPVAICHAFDADDQMFLVDAGAVLCDRLPDDWVYQVD